MNDCQIFQSLFSEYLDNRLDQAGNAQIETHLTACQHCHAEWQCFCSAVKMLQEAEMIPPPPGILTGVHRKLAGRPSPAVFFQRLADWIRQTDFSMSLPTAAGTVAVALVAMLIVRDFPTRKNFMPTQPAPELAAGQETNRPEPQQQMAASDNPARQNPAPQAQPAAAIQEAAGASGIQPLSLDQHLTELHWQFLADSYRYAPRGSRLTTVSTGPQAPAERQPQSFGETLANPGQASFYNNFFQVAAQHPDVEITVRNCVDENSRLTLCRKIINSTDWMSKVHDGNTILLAVPPSKIPLLSNLFTEHDTVFMPPQAREATFASPRKSILVAVRLQ